MHLLSYNNTHYYKKFKLKDKASKHVQVSKSANSLEKKMLQKHKHWQGIFSSSAFYVFYGKLIIRILIKKCQWLEVIKKLNKDR
jgi:hypothetical protein